MDLQPQAERKKLLGRKGEGKNKKKYHKYINIVVVCWRTFNPGLWIELIKVLRDGEQM